MISHSGDRPDATSAGNHPTTKTLRALIVLALLGAVTAASHADTVSGPGLCDICTIAPGTEATDEDQASWLAESACRLAQRITCQDAHSCWMTPILANVVASAGRMATTLPALIACDPNDDCGASSPIVWVFYAFAALTLAIDAARIFVLGTSEWTAVVARLARIIVVLIIFQASTAGLGRWLWDWTGHMEATGALIGRTASLEIQRYTDPGATSSTRCHSLLPTTTIIDEGPALLDMSRWTNGWHTTQHLAFILLSETTDVSGILAGTAWLLVPNWKGMLGLPARMAYGLTHGDLCPVFETVRMLFAVTLFATAIALALTVAFQILESILLIGFAIGLTPVLAALSVWRPTRGAAHYAVAGVVYAVLSLATLGITLEVSYRLFENALMRFATEIRHPDFPVVAASGPDLHSVLATCGLAHTITRTTPTGDQVTLKSESLFEAFHVVLCLSQGPEATVLLDATATHARSGGSCAPSPVETAGWLERLRARVTSPEEIRVNVKPTVISNDVLSWLPQIFLLLASGVILTAVIRYANAAAGEIAGYQANASQVAQQAIGATRSMALGAGRLGGRLIR